MKKYPNSIVREESQTNKTQVFGRQYFAVGLVDRPSADYDPIFYLSHEIPKGL